MEAWPISARKNGSKPDVAASRYRENKTQSVMGQYTFGFANASLAEIYPDSIWYIRITAQDNQRSSYGLLKVECCLPLCSESKFEQPRDKGVAKLLLMRNRGVPSRHFIWICLVKGLHPDYGWLGRCEIGANVTWIAIGWWELSILWIRPHHNREVSDCRPFIVGKPMGTSIWQGLPCNW